MSGPRTYFAIDLKSYYASAECAARGLDPLTTNLVVAGRPAAPKRPSAWRCRPSLKALGIPGRARLFEVVQKVKEANDAPAAGGHPQPRRREKGGQMGPVCSQLRRQSPGGGPRRWKSATWWPRPGWPTTRRCPGRSTAST